MTGDRRYAHVAKDFIEASREEEARVRREKPGLPIAMERAARHGIEPTRYCVRCGAGDPPYSQLCGFASWHVTEDFAAARLRETRP